jgi:hypothetical protein
MAIGALAGGAAEAAPGAQVAQHWVTPHELPQLLAHEVPQVLQLRWLCTRL